MTAAIAATIQRWSSLNEETNGARSAFVHFFEVVMRNVSKSHLKA